MQKNAGKTGFGKGCIPFLTNFLRPNEVVRVIRLRSSNNRANNANSEGGKSRLPSTLIPSANKRFLC